MFHFVQTSAQSAEAFGDLGNTIGAIVGHSLATPLQIYIHCVKIMLPILAHGSHVMLTTPCPCGHRLCHLASQNCLS